MVMPLIYCGTAYAVYEIYPAVNQYVPESVGYKTVLGLSLATELTMDIHSNACAVAKDSELFVEHLLGLTGDTEGLLG